MPSFANSIVERCCNNNCSTWVTREQLEVLLKKEGGSIVDIDAAAKAKEIVRYRGLYTTKKLNEIENEVVENILKIQFQFYLPQIDSALIYNHINDFECYQNNGFRLDATQKIAVVNTINNRVSILTGGPGTGKTTVLRCIAYCLRQIEKNLSIMFTAPTGKASKQVESATGENAVTTQKYFAFGLDGYANRQSVSKVLFIDEASFLDLKTLHQIVIHIQSDTRLVFVGDPNQLPSVGVGSCLRDMIGSKSIPYVQLTKTFRQDESSALYANIKAIENGCSALSNGNDFCEIPISSNYEDKQLAYMLLNMYVQERNRYGEDVVILVPSRRTKISTTSINSLIQRNLNKTTEIFTCKKNGVTYLFKLNDPVMQLKNKKDVVNGDIGKVVTVEKEKIVVSFSKHMEVYDKNNIDELELAYAITIHKSQGSQYRCAITLLLNEHSKMCNRNLLFTAISRSKEKHIFIYQEKAFGTCIMHDADENRYSFLAEKLESLKIRYQITYDVA